MCVCVRACVCVIAIDNHDNTVVGLDKTLYFFGDLITVIVVIVVVIVVTLKEQIKHNKHTKLNITRQYSYKVMSQTVIHTY